MSTHVCVCVCAFPHGRVRGSTLDCSFCLIFWCLYCRCFSWTVLKCVRRSSKSMLQARWRCCGLPWVSLAKGGRRGEGEGGGGRKFKFNTVLSSFSINVYLACSLILFIFFSLRCKQTKSRQGEESRITKRNRHTNRARKRKTERQRE